MTDERIDISPFDQPWDPITTSAMLRLERSITRRMGNILDGTTTWKRQLFDASTELTISAGAISAPTRFCHTIAAQSGTDDELDTIGAANGHYLLVKAKTGHTISVRPGRDNISSESGARVRVTGNRAALLFCENSQWGLVGGGDALTTSSTADPGSGDDCLDGYSEGSLWINTSKNRVWLCTNAAAGAAAWKWISPPVNGWSIRAAPGNTVQGDGASGSVGGAGGTTTLDADGTWLAMSPSGVGTAATIYTGTAPNLGQTRWNYEPVWETLLKTGGDLTSQRIWVALIDSGGVVDADTLTNPAVAFRFSSVAGDAGWRPVNRDSTTQSVGSQVGANLAINTVYKLRVRFEADGVVTAYFSVNDGAEVQHSTNLPAITQDLVLHTVIYSQSVGARTLNYGISEVYW